MQLVCVSKSWKILLKATLLQGRFLKTVPGSLVEAIRSPKEETKSAGGKQTDSNQLPSDYVILNRYYWSWVYLEHRYICQVMTLNDIFFVFWWLCNKHLASPAGASGSFFCIYWARGNISQPPGHFSRGLNLAQVQRQTDTISLLMLQHNHTDASIVVADVEPF